MKSTLVRALCECVDHSQRKRARQFLQGLSEDELQYIAEFLGCCILESAAHAPLSRRQLADGIAQFERCRANASSRIRHRTVAARDKATGDQDHKMILLLEYLCRAGLTQYSVGVRTGRF